MEDYENASFPQRMVPYGEAVCYGFWAPRVGAGMFTGAKHPLQRGGVPAVWRLRGVLLYVLPGREGREEERCINDPWWG